MIRFFNFSAKTALASLFYLLCLTSLTAQTTVTGTVRDLDSRSPLPGAEVRLADKLTLTDADGVFRIEVALSNEQVLLSVHKDGFLDEDREIMVGSGARTNVGVINLRSAGTDEQQAVIEELIPTIILDSDDVGTGSAQNVSGVLTASRDAFTSAAAFTFGPLRFRIRGYDAPETEVYLNGMPVNELESGRVFWSNWGGLNDVLRNRTNVIGLDAVTFGFGAMGGISNTDTRASLQRPQLRVNYAISNRTYRNRMMATYSTGLLDNGWALSLSASRRWGDEGFIPGTFFDGYSYFMSVDRKINDNHMLNLTVLGAPAQRGRGSGAIQELYDLSGSNYYNANWGFQNGKVRNSRVGDIHQPIATLRHDWNIGDKATLTTTLGGQIGRAGNSALNWYNANDPRPDYYRKLPSFYDDGQEAAVAELFRTREDVRQVNWDRMYEINRFNIETIEDANGIEGNDVTGARAQYIVEDRRSDSRRFSVNTVLEAFLSDQVTFDGGLTYQNQQIEYFTTVKDLLGADFYVDINRFAEFVDSTGGGQFVQNNVNCPNCIIREGERFGYDYTINISQASAWGQFEITLPKVDLFAGVRATTKTYWREGFVENGVFLEESIGESERVNSFNYELKAGLTYKVDGRNYLFVNGSYRTRAPFARDAFASPRQRNQITPGLTDTKIFGVEGGYLLRAPNIKARAVAYYTTFTDQVRNRSFFLDNNVQGEDAGFINYIMTGIDTRHMGLELAAEFKLTSSLRASAVAAIGEYIFTSRPEATFFVDIDRNAVLQRDPETIYIKNFYVPGTPQQAYTVGLSYNDPDFWFLNINANYLTDRYLDFYPERRTIGAVSNVLDDPEVLQEVIDPDSPLFQDIIGQERLDDAFTIDIFGGKSFKFNDVFLYLNVGVNNVLDNQDIRTGGFEQFRFDFEGKDVNRFPARYFYGFGRNYFIQLALRL